MHLISRSVVGRCSECGGKVTMPAVTCMLAIWPPPPPPLAKCDDCGAVEDRPEPDLSHLPVVKMKRGRQPVSKPKSGTRG